MAEENNAANVETTDDSPETVNEATETAAANSAEGTEATSETTSNEANTESSTEAQASAEGPASTEAQAPAGRVDVVQPELSDALSNVRIDDSTPRKEVANGRAYEIIFIARVGDAEAVEASTQRVRELIEGVDGAVDNVRTSETRRLAYPIKKEIEGIYVVINARFEKSLTNELDRFFKLEESVLRHMLIREDD